MMVNVNCVECKDGIYCNDTRIKRSLLGLGARMCKVADGKTCWYQIKRGKPNITPKGQGTRN